MRHSSITRLARNPNINEYTLRQYAGWTKTSNMIEIYTHELKGESFESVMLACGINLKDKKETQQLPQELEGKVCSYCKMQNLPDAQFCSQCEYTLDTEAFLKAREETEETKKKLGKILDSMDQKMIQDAENDTLIKELKAVCDRISVDMQAGWKRFEELETEHKELDRQLAVIRQEKEKEKEKYNL